jgi:hypothetical protein
MVKVKVKSLWFFLTEQAPRHEGVMGEWSASCRSCFTPRKRAPGTHWIGGWVGLRTILDAMVKEKNSQPLPDSNPPITQPVARRYATELSRLLFRRTYLKKSSVTVHGLGALACSDSLTTNPCTHLVGLLAEVIHRSIAWFKEKNNGRKFVPKLLIIFTEFGIIFLEIIRR